MLLSYVPQIRAVLIYNTAYITELIAFRDISNCTKDPELPVHRPSANAVTQGARAINGGPLFHGFEDQGTCGRI